MISVNFSYFLLIAMRKIMRCSFYCANWLFNNHMIHFMRTIFSCINHIMASFCKLLADLNNASLVP